MWSSEHTIERVCTVKQSGNSEGKPLADLQVPRSAQVARSIWWWTTFQRQVGWRGMRVTCKDREKKPEEAYFRD